MAISLESLSTNSVPATAFANAIAAKTVTDKESMSYTHEQLGIRGKGMVEEVSGQNTFCNCSFYIKVKHVNR